MKKKEHNLRSLKFCNLNIIKPSSRQVHWPICIGNFLIYFTDFLSRSFYFETCSPSILLVRLNNLLFMKREKKNVYILLMMVQNGRWTLTVRSSLYSKSKKNSFFVWKSAHKICEIECSTVILIKHKNKQTTKINSLLFPRTIQKRWWSMTVWCFPFLCCFPKTSSHLKNYNFFQNRIK